MKKALLFVAAIFGAICAYICTISFLSRKYGEPYEDDEEFDYGKDFSYGALYGDLGDIGRYNKYEDSDSDF